MIIPMSLRNISEYLATVSICFIKFVNIPANTKITPSPNANINSIRSEINMLFVIAAKRKYRLLTVMPGKGYSLWIMPGDIFRRKMEKYILLICVKNVMINC